MTRACLADAPIAEAEIVDLTRVGTQNLDPLWQRETRLWRDTLYWDVSSSVAAVREVMGRGALEGKAVIVGDRVVGCGCYTKEGSRAVLGAFLVADDALAQRLGAWLVRSLVETLKLRRTVHRIETQFVPTAMPWLPEVFEAEGFRRHRRMFLRRSLGDHGGPFVDGEGGFSLEPWNLGHVATAAPLMQSAHQGSVDAQMNELYRSRRGCRTLLENLVYQRGCGNPIRGSSYVLRRRSESSLSGVVLTTEISARHAHLAQLAISPSDQGLGLGKRLLMRVMDSLSRSGFETLSLMVSEENLRARALYERMGFRCVLEFPVFTWDRMNRRPRSR